MTNTCGNGGKQLHRFLKPGGHGNVVFNFRGHAIEDLVPYAMGYRLAARWLARALGEAPGYADYEGYPILFLYRHSLELYIKAIVYKGAKLLGLLDQAKMETKGLFSNHRLSPLLRPLHTIFAAMGWDMEGSGLVSMADFDNLIESLDEIDADSYAFRYPISKKRKPYLPTHFVLNPVRLGAQLEPLLNSLEGATERLTEEFEVAAEARYELQQWLANDESV